MMKIYALIFSAVLSFPVSSYACIGDREAVLRQNLRFYPIVGDTTSHWPAQQDIVIGSIASFLVPIDAKIELHDIQRGSMDPLTILAKASHEQMRTSRIIAPRWVDIEHNPKKFKWVHIHASSYGVTEVRMRGPGGWTKSLKFSMVYPSQTDKAMRPPVELSLGQGEMQTIEVDAYDNIEVTVPGRTSDGWTASPASETGFDLIRIQQVQKIDGQPQVRLFFAGTRNPKNATMILQPNSGTPTKTIEFKIKAIATAAC